MNHRLPARRTLCLLAFCALVLSACLTPTTTLHSLQPVRQQPLARDFADFAEMILFMPVQLAPHLQGRGLVDQRASGEARLSGTHLWAGPLDQQIGQQMVSNLKDLLATDNVALYPGPRFGTIRYQLEVEMSEFSGDDRTFTLVAVYTLSDATNKTMLARKTFRQTRDIDKPDYSGYVASASLALVDLSKEAATALLAARRSQPLPATRP